MQEMNVYSIFVPVACIIGMAFAGLAAGFSVRNIVRKKYRVYSVIYIALSGIVAAVLAQMLSNALSGIVCARGPLLTVLLYAGTDALLAFILVDTVFAGERKKQGKE